MPELYRSGELQWSNINILIMLQHTATANQEGVGETEIHEYFKDCVKVKCEGKGLI
jgi:hypothetical protein